MQGFTALVLLLLVLPFGGQQADACELVLAPDCSKELPGSYHPHEQTCNNFYRCDELGKATSYACPVGKRFLGQNGELCVPEARVACERCPPQPVHFVEQFEECLPACPETPECQSNMRGDLLPYPPDCSKYIYCDGSNPIISDCEPGYEFSATESECMPTGQAGCEDCDSRNQI